MSRKKRPGSPLSHIPGLGSPSPPLPSGTVHGLLPQTSSPLVPPRGWLDTPSWLPSLSLSVSMALTT